MVSATNKRNASVETDITLMTTQLMGISIEGNITEI